MAPNRFNHIDLRVTDIDEALRFYGRLLPALGLSRTRHGPVWKVFATEAGHPASCYFGFTESKGHRPNENRIAFWADSREEVDRLGALAREAGGRNVEGPKPCPQYTPTYYAVFFEDPSGNRLEICHRTD